MEPSPASTPQTLSSAGSGTAMRSAAAAAASLVVTSASSQNCDERPWSNGVHHHLHHNSYDQQQAPRQSSPAPDHHHNNNNSNSNNNSSSTNTSSHHYYRHQENQQQHHLQKQQQHLHYQNHHQQLQPKPAHLNNNNNNNNNNNSSSTADAGEDSDVTMTLDEEGSHSSLTVGGTRADVFHSGGKPGPTASSPQPLSVSSTPEPPPVGTATAGETERGGGSGVAGGERGRGGGGGLQPPAPSSSTSLSPSLSSLSPNPMTTAALAARTLLPTTSPHPHHHHHPPPSGHHSHPSSSSSSAPSSSSGPRPHQHHHHLYPNHHGGHHHPRPHQPPHPQQDPPPPTPQHYGANPHAPSASSSSSLSSSSSSLSSQRHHPHHHPPNPHHHSSHHHHHHQIHVVDNPANNSSNSSGGASLWGSAANLRSPPQQQQQQHQQQQPPPPPPQQQQQQQQQPSSSSTLPQPQPHASAFVLHRSLDHSRHPFGSGASAGSGGGGGGGSIAGGVVVGGGGGGGVSGGGVGFEPLPLRMPFEAQGGGGGVVGAPPPVGGSKPPPMIVSANGRNVNHNGGGRGLVVERARCAIGDPSAGCEKVAAAAASAAGSNGGGGAGVAMTTSQPSNASELQLYNVLKRANLLQYYDTFIAQGGDDVQQLCEAGEDEFLEIMALVGMAAKPLHVRRLQKALQEWVANPAALEANAKASFPLSGPAPGSISAVVRETVSMQVHSTQTTPAVVTAPTWTPQAPSRSISPSDSVPPSPSSASPVDGKEDRSGSPMLQPVLMESQIQAIATAAAGLGKQLPYFQPKDLNPKRPINRDIQNLINSPESTSNKIEELRKYAAIYGRFDSKRKNDRPMSLHEISVNEAAAQLCLHCPSLLTRREDLFPLARQVVRDSGYQYSKGHSRAAEVVVSARKGRLDPIFQRHFDTNFKNVKQEYDKDAQEERMSAVAQELASIRQHQEQVKAELVTATEEQDVQQTQKLQSELASLTSQQLQVLQEHSDLLKRPRSKLSRSRQNNSDDNGKDDASGTSSPSFDTENLSSLASATFDSLYAAIRSSKGTLFEEGLRIAQQYGMAEFAVELQQLQTQRQSDGPGGVGAATAENGDSIAKVLEQPFELKEVKPGFDSGIGDDSMDGDAVPSGEVPRSKAASPGGGAMQMVTRSVENGVQTVDTGTLVSTTQCKGDNKPDLKRKGDNLDSVPSRPPSRRSRSCQSGGVA